MNLFLQETDKYFNKNYQLVEGGPTVSESNKFGNWLLANGVKNPKKFIKDHNIWMSYKRNANDIPTEIKDIDKILDITITSKRHILHYIDNTKNESSRQLKAACSNSIDDLLNPSKSISTGTNANTKNFKISFGNWCKQNNLLNLLKHYSPENKESPYDFGAKSEQEKIFICDNCGKSFLKSPNSITNTRGQDIALLNHPLCKECGEQATGNKNFNTYLERNGSFRDNAPDQLLLEWNYEKNKGLVNNNGEQITPDNISVSYKKDIWWKCSTCYTEYATSPDVRLRNYSKTHKLQISCPQCKMHFGTSKAETTVYYYVKQLFPDAEHNYRKIKGISELDIYIPKNNKFPNGFAIEYNGSYWHKDKIEQDKIKKVACKNANIPLIIIEGLNEKTVPNLDQKHNGIYSYYYQDTDTFEAIIKDIFNKYLKSNTDINLERDDKAIEELRVTNLKNLSFASRYPNKALDWNYKLNDNLNPINFRPSKRDMEFNWKCHICGYEWKSTLISRVQARHQCPQQLKNKEHQNWTQEKENIYLGMQNKYFNHEISKEEFIKFLNQE